MSVFISWSGENSATVGEAFHQLLRHTLQGLPIFISSDAIRSGALWFPRIQEGLDQAKFGVVIATRRALDSPWVLFESGAIWKAKSETAIAVLRVGLTVDDLRGHPLEHFHSKGTSQGDMLKLVSDIARACGLRVDDDVLTRAFQSNWAAFAETVRGLREEETPQRQRPEVDALSLMAQRLGSLEQFALDQSERDRRMLDLMDRMVQQPSVLQANALGGLGSLFDGVPLPPARRGLFGSMSRPPAGLADALANSMEAAVESPASTREEPTQKGPSKRGKKPEGEG